MKTKSIIFFVLFLSASLSTPVVFADYSAKDDFDARIEQMNKRYAADRAGWEKRKNMSFEELRAQDDARWAEGEKQHNVEMEAREKSYQAAKTEWDKRKNMSFEERSAQDTARWAEREKQYEVLRAKLDKGRNMSFEKRRAQDAARWAEREARRQQYEKEREEWMKNRGMRR